MKKLVVFAVLAAIVASCADDNPPQIEKSSELVSPRLLMDVSTESGQSPLTGILTIMPCKAGTSIYYGNYINRKLTPFYGYYQVKDGAFYNDGVNRELSLPAGLYNMIYWGTPKYEEPIYAHPLMRDPVYILGEDMSRQHFSLFKMEADTTYYPVFDLVHAVQPANIGSEDLKASLKRVVTGLKVIIKDKNNGILSSSIDSMVVRITNIAGERRSSRKPTHSSLPSGPFRRRYTNEQRHRHALPFFRETGIPDEHHTEKWKREKFQANIERTFGSKLQTDPDPHSGRHLFRRIIRRIHP